MVFLPTSNLQMVSFGGCHVTGNLLQRVEDNTMTVASTGLCTDDTARPGLSLLVDSEVC